MREKTDHFIKRLAQRSSKLVKNNEEHSEEKKAQESREEAAERAKLPLKRDRKQEKIGNQAEPHPAKKKRQESSADRESSLDKHEKNKEEKNKVSDGRGLVKEEASEDSQDEEKPKKLVRNPSKTKSANSNISSKRICSKRPEFVYPTTSVKKSSKLPAKDNPAEKDEKSDSESPTVSFDVAFKKISTDKKMKMKKAFLESSIETMNSIFDIISKKCKSAIGYGEKALTISIDSMTYEVFDEIWKIIKVNK